MHTVKEKMLILLYILLIVFLLSFNKQQNQQPF